VKREQNLHRLNENKDRVLSILSHDLRSPLGNLHSVLQLVNNGLLSEEEKRHTLEKINGRVFNMLEFLDTTLQWSKINFNDFQIKAQVVEVETISGAILAIYQPAYAEKQIKVVSKINSSLPLRCDPEIFSILFRNIFSNAIKYTPDSGVITIDNAVINDRYVLSMENSGVGISEEKIQKIFSKNYASEPGTHGEKGLGLGLRLCLQLLENISGRLEIERKNSEGTIVRVVL
jgi:signal transduction histidine kinase